MRSMVFILLCLATTAGAQVRCHVEGTLMTDRWGDEVIICPQGTDMRVGDKAEYHVRAVNGRFTTDITAAVPTMYKAYFENEAATGGFYSSQFLVEDGTVNLTMYADSAHKVVSTGLEGRRHQTLDSLESLLFFREVREIRNRLQDSKNRLLYFQPQFLEVEDIVAHWDKDSLPRAYVDSIYNLMNYYWEDVSRSYTYEGWALWQRADNIKRQAQSYRMTYYAEKPMLWVLYDILHATDMLLFDKNNPEAYRDFDAAQWQHYITLYDQTYRHQYPGHPLHAQIQTALTALCLSPNIPNFLWLVDRFTIRMARHRDHPKEC